MERVRLVINSQTPLIRFREGSLTGEPKFTTGGVTRMLLPLLTTWLEEGTVASARWIALAGREDAPEVEHRGVTLSFVGIPPEEQAGYALVKERLWAMLNSNPSTPAPHGQGGIPDDAWAAFDAYQRRCARSLLSASADEGADLLYVHDFQQMGVASAWQGPRIPRVFHLHTPFPSASVLPRAWADHVVGELHRFDRVIVSTKRYAENLRAAGLETPIDVIPPFIDPCELPHAGSAEQDAFRARLGIPQSDRIVLHVGRMDPMKGQDRLLRALPAILRGAPDARLLLVGNGSFSSSKNGGLGLSKGAQWRAALEALARKLHVTHRVTFAGHLEDDELAAAYATATVSTLPSTREGFGLAAIEAWRHAKPIVVSDRAGVADLVEDRVNGRVVDCSDVDALAASLVDILRDPDHARWMGKAGLEASDVATLPVGRRAIERAFDEVLQGARAHVAA